MSDAGYTLAEMLVALVIVGATAGAMTEGAVSLARIQGAAAASLSRGRVQARVQQSFAAFLRDRGPFRSGPDGDLLRGDGAGLDFGCGASTCHVGLNGSGSSQWLALDDGQGGRARFALPGGGDTRFVYGDGETLLAAWPPKEEGRLLRTVSILSDAGPVAVAELALQQPADCQFDPIVRACRKGADGRR